MAMKTSLIEENFCNQEERERKKNIETIINELMYWIDTKIRDIFYEFDKKTVTNFFLNLLHNSFYRSWHYAITSIEQQRLSTGGVSAVDPDHRSIDFD